MVKARPRRPLSSPKAPLPQIQDLRIEKWVHSGQSLAKPSSGPFAGMAIFIDGGVPGDIVEVQVTQQKKRWAKAKLLSISKKSDMRQDAPCPYLESCGGCPWMEGTKDLQLASRKDILSSEIQKNLGEESSQNLAFRETHQDFGYRTRVVMHFQIQKSQVSLGFFGRNSHQLVDIPHCAVASAAINEKLPLVKAALEKRYANAKHAEGSVTFLEGKEGVSILMKTPRGTSWTLGPKEVTMNFGSFQQSLEPASFTQANSEVTGEILEELRLWARRHGLKHVIEFFAGSGTLSMPLFLEGCEVSAYEIDEKAKPKFLATMKRLKGKGSWHAANLMKPFTLPHQDQLAGEIEGKPVDGALLDPPRAGAAALVPWLIENGPAEIAYLSCNHSTAIRDIQKLQSEGHYTLSQTLSFDMFPQTGHQEVLFFLSR